jgi:hypothetical protein
MAIPPMIWPASRLRVEDPAAIDGRHDSSDADGSEVWIDVDLDEVRGDPPA